MSEITQSNSHDGSLMPIIHQIATDPKGDANTLEKLLDIQTKWEDREAKKAFSRAFAALQAEMPPMQQTKEVAFSAKGGYSYTPLADYLIMAQPYFSKYGFCCRYDQFIPDNAPAKVGVTFILTHADGHSESSSLAADIQPPIKGRDGKEVQTTTQALAATVESLRRYTFRSLLCIKNVDEDIQERLRQQPTYSLTEEETLDLAQKIEAAHQNKNLFLDCFAVKHLHEIPRTALPRAKLMLDSKVRQLEGGSK